MPNHPTVPALEGVKPASISGVDCEALKAEFDIETGSHKENTSGSTKLNSNDYQSHHIVQDAQTNSIIDRGLASAVMLYNSHSGTEHGTITSRQNERMRNKASGASPGPAGTFGELKEQAKGDLMAGLEERRKEKRKSKKKLEQLADCLIAEAEKKVKNAYKKKNGRNMTNATPVDPPGECLAAETSVWIDGNIIVAAEKIVPGMLIETLTGPMKVIRTDKCNSSLIEIELLGNNISLAPFHRVLTNYGYYLRADGLRTGHEVKTESGKATITKVNKSNKNVTVYNFGVGRESACKIGTVGLYVEIEDTGPPVIRKELVTALQIKE
jgi:hypothetical protein